MLSARLSELRYSNRAASAARVEAASGAVDRVTPKQNGTARALPLWGKKTQAPIFAGSVPGRLLFLEQLCTDLVAKIRAGLFASNRHHWIVTVLQYKSECHLEDIWACDNLKSMRCSQLMHFEDHL